MSKDEVVITIKDDTKYLLANYSRNMVSTYRIQELVNDDFEIKVTCKIDWQTIVKSNQNFTGVVCFNGAHFGILCKIYDGQPVISAEVWSEDNDEHIVNEAHLLISKDKLDEEDWRDITLVYKKNKSISIKTDEGEKITEIQGKILDYQNAYLWIGCCDNHMPTPQEFRGDWFGQIKYIHIKGKKEYFGKYEFNKKTRYKIYDSSGNGNHLISKYLNDDAHNHSF